MHHTFTRYATLALALVAGSAVAAACDGGDPAAPVLSEDGGLVEASTNVQSNQPGCGGEPTFAAIRTSVFDKSCAFGACHGGKTPAAGLDLSSDKACELLVGHQSCVFKNRLRVVPGHPEQSYLYAKVSGEDLGTNPDGTCAGLTNGTPSRMPIGGEALCQGAIDQVKAWIVAGAPCDKGGDGDASTDSGDAQADADAGGVAVATLTSTSQTVAAGAALTVTITLNAPAPAGGEDVTITSSDPAVLSTVGEVVLIKGDTTTTFQVHGVKAGTVELKAHTPSQGQPITLNLTVTG